MKTNKFLYLSPKAEPLVVQIEGGILSASDYSLENNFPGNPISEDNPFNF